MTKILKQKDFKSAAFIENKEVGEYMEVKIFKPGRLYHWNDMIEKATGEKLTAKYFGYQFVE